jgi:TM2 domain-containing membrane protein YozV
MKSKGTAYILWVLGGLGILGFHRFYLGKVGTGLIWLFTGGLVGVGALVDLFTLGRQVDMYNVLRRGNVNVNNVVVNVPSDRAN